MEEMNLDTNILNVGIMADEISKFNKGYKRKENKIGFSPIYFGLKEGKNPQINTKFFPGQIDIRKTDYNDKEGPSEKLDKIKPFYQDGLSRDKKRLLMQKHDNLSKIVETKEDDDLEVYKGRNKFFNKEQNGEMCKTNDRNIKNNKKPENKISEYKDYLNSEQVELESQIKSEKRETTTNKFFNANPPKKDNNNATSSFNFNEKDQQKTAKSNAPFFSDDNIEIININKTKKKNIFQQEYDSSYKPAFKGPKVINENLGFYNNDITDFEQRNNEENKNPPYFGSRFGKTLPIIEEKVKNENAEMRVGFYFKNRQIDFIEDDEKLPELAEILTFEQKMEEFHSYSISFKKFLVKNIFSRHVLLTTFDRMNIVYDRYMRAGNFAAQLSMFAFFLTLFFTNDEKQTAYVTKEKNQMLNFALYCFISDILGCISVHLPAYCFWVNDKKFRQLYNTILLDDGINVLKLTEEIIKEGRLFWNILGFIIQIFFIIIGFYFSFGFCAVYSYQSSTFCFALICTCGFDILVCEFLWEIFIGILFYIRDTGRIVVFLGTILNTLRNIKHLV